MMEKKKWIWIPLFLLLGGAALFPVVYTLGNSLMSPGEVKAWYDVLFSENAEDYAKIHILPEHFSLNGYYQILLRRPEYLLKFWLSLLMCGKAVGIQLLVSIMGGFAFAKYKWKGQKWLYAFLILLMMMPVQVTLVPNYIVLGWLKLLDSWWALILPLAFSPFGTFLMTQTFKGIPDELLDAAKLDGATVWQRLFHILAPIGKGGMMGLFLLSFIDAWNMVEQPVVFLRDERRYPLSVFLAEMNAENFPLSYACGVLAALPVVLLFLFFKEELIEGIEYAGIK